MAETCSQGNKYWYPSLDGHPVYEPECGLPAAVRYRQPSFPEGHWLYRCAKHGRGYLSSDTSRVIIEDLDNWESNHG